MNVQQAERSGKLVVETKQATLSYGDTLVVAPVTTVVLRGDRVGIIGPNGCGKTTLLRMLLGELAPEEGSVRLGTRLQVAYFDQLRAQLDPVQTVADSVAGGAERVELGGRSRHVLGYLEDFLFEPDRARTPVGALSGGERNRLLLARLFLRPSNLLVLDEPTNDLDVDTLELLEGKLIAYGGTVLLVSHDRTFLDNVVTSTLAFEGDGRFGEYAGGYSDWLQQKGADPAPAGSPQPVAAKTAKPRTRVVKLTFKEKRELAALPAEIERLESEQAALQAQLSDPSFYRDEGDAVAGVKVRLEAIAGELEAVYQRWQTLEDIADDAQQ